MKAKPIVSATLALALLTGCQGTGVGPKEGVGTLGGAAVGGLIGSQIGGGTGQMIATGAGVLLGAFLGREIGSSLDRADEAYAQRAANTAFETYPSGTRAEWHNPDSGNYGYVTPGRATETNGQYCRTFTQTIYVNGRAETADGRACRNDDGTWRIVG